MIVLGYGFILNDVGDESSTAWMVTANTNAQLLNDHTHNGVNSALISSTSFIKTSQDVDASAWVLVGGGIYSQGVSMPLGFEFDNVLMQFIITAGPAVDEIWYPTVVKTGVSAFDIFSNDNTIEFTVRYV